MYSPSPPRCKPARQKMVRYCSCGVSVVPWDRHWRMHWAILQDQWTNRWCTCIISIKNDPKCCESWSVFTKQSREILNCMGKVWSLLKATVTRWNDHGIGAIGLILDKVGLYARQWKNYWRGKELENKSNGLSVAWKSSGCPGSFAKCISKRLTDTSQSI